MSAKYKFGLQKIWGETCETLPLRVHGLKTARARRFDGRRQAREKVSVNAQGVRLP